MLEVEKQKNGNGYDLFRIVTDEGVFEISFENNLDLYWRYDYHGNILEHPKEVLLVVSQENYEIYSMFDRLYNKILEGNPLELAGNVSTDWTISENNPESLIQNGIVRWHSDDFIYENASWFSVMPTEDEYIISFGKSKLVFDDMLLMTFAVRIRNSGSRYYPYNVPFMQMYHELQEYDPEYHQMRIEELAYKSKKRSLSKKEER